MSAILNRRAALGSLAGLAALAVPVAAFATIPAEPDAEIIALAAEIVRRCAEAETFLKARIDPFQDQFDEIAHSPGRVTEASLDEAFAFSRECGRDAAIREVNAFDDVTDDRFKRLMSIPATTQAGRAAKVRVLLVHVMPSEWLGPAAELDWDKDMARALLGEFAGLTDAELDAI